MESLKTLVGLGGDNIAQQSAADTEMDTSRHSSDEDRWFLPEKTALVQSGKEPVSGVQGAGTVDEPYDAGNREDATEGSRQFGTSVKDGQEMPHNATDQQTEHLPDQTAPLSSSTTSPLNTITSIFTNPFANGGRAPVATNEAPMDPKVELSAGEERNIAIQSVVVEPRPENFCSPDAPAGQGSPKRDKGKGKVYDDSSSSRTQTSESGRNESIATSHTGPSTLASSRGGIPTAGGIPLGERARMDRERRESKFSGASPQRVESPSSPQQHSLKKVVEDGESEAERTGPTGMDATTTTQSGQPLSSSKFAEQVNGNNPAASAGGQEKWETTATTYSPGATAERRKSSIGRLAQSISRKLNTKKIFSG